MLSEQDMWLWLTVAFGPANPRKWNVLEYYDGSVCKCYGSVTNGDYSRIMPQDLKKVKAASDDRVLKLREICDKNGIKICAYNENEYPENLKEIYNPPSVLFYTGDISGLSDYLVLTVVGTRKPSDYSVKVCKKICDELTRKSVRIASGFAVGIDSISHRAAILAGGLTFAVLPCGHLYNYPKENADAKALISKRGAVISEYFPSDKPTTLSFRARNRILSGISHGTLIIQAGEKSGSLSTASFAVSQGRDIFCIPPHDIFDTSYSGVDNLLRSGATIVFSSEDIMQSYRHSSVNNFKEEIVQAVTDPSKKKDEAVKKSEHNRPANLISVPIAPPIELEGKKLEIYNYLKEHGETHLDELAIGIGDVFELEAYLTELELDGVVELMPGNRFKIL